MNTISYEGMAEFFASRVQHVEDLRNGCVRIYFCTDKRPLDGPPTTEAVLTIVLPKSAISATMNMMMAVVNDVAAALPQSYESPALQIRIGR